MAARHAPKDDHRAVGVGAHRIFEREGVDGSIDDLEHAPRSSAPAAHGWDERHLVTIVQDRIRLHVDMVDGDQPARLSEPWHPTFEVLQETLTAAPVGSVASRCRVPAASRYDANKRTWTPMVAAEVVSDTSLSIGFLRATPARVVPEV